MKQRFDQGEANGRSHAGARADLGPTPAPENNHAQPTVATPAPTSGAWLSEALKLWCTDPQAPH
jgi:hypothetical protein